MPITEEKRKYLKEYRQKNKIHIRKVSQARYLRNRERDIAKSKEWAKNNSERLQAYYIERDKKNPELRKLRDKTRYYFREVKKNSKCEKCGIKARLEFHHLEPCAFDNFQILCRECHREIHGKLLVRNDSFEVQSE